MDQVILNSAARDLAESIFSLPEYIGATDIAAYSAVNGEISLDPVIDQALAQGKNIYLPNLDHQALRFAPYSRLQKMRINRFKLPEPDVSDDELLERFIPGIQRVNSNFERSWVKDVWVHKSEYAQPVPLLNHSANIPAIRTPIKGLYFANMSQVYPWDRGTNFAVEIGRRAAGQMLGKEGP